MDGGLSDEAPRRYDLVAPRRDEGPIDLTAWPPGDGPLEIDVGFGRGRSLFARAEAAPGARLLGVEIKRKWAYKVEERRKARGLERVRVLAGDARDVLSRCEPTASVARVFVHFPDPWWKKRHRKRRLVDAGFLDLVARLLEDGGELYVQTDVPDRALAYREEIERHPALRLLPAPPDNPFGNASNRERRALADGLPIHRLLARRAPR